MKGRKIMLVLLFGMISFQFLFGFQLFVYIFKKFNDSKKINVIYISIGAYLIVAFLAVFNVLHPYYALIPLVLLNIVFAIYSFMIVVKSVLSSQKKIVLIDLVMNILVPILLVFGFSVYSDYLVINKFSYAFVNIDEISFAIFMLIIILIATILTMSLHVTLKYYNWSNSNKHSLFGIMDQVTSNKSYVISGLIGMVLGIIMIAEAEISLTSVRLESYYQTLDVYKSIFLAFALPAVYDYLIKRKN